MCDVLQNIIFLYIIENIVKLVFPENLKKYPSSQCLTDKGKEFEEREAARGGHERSTV